MVKQITTHAVRHTRRLSIARSLGVALVAILAAVLFPSQAWAQPNLILAVHPYLPYDQLMARFSPLADYLSQHLGAEVTVRIGRDYQEHIDFVGMDKVDLAFMGPAPYVKMVETYGRKPLLARLEINGEPVFQGKLIVRKDSPIRSLADLHGKRFAFGDKGSTMSHLIPRYLLWKAGITNEQLGDYRFLGSHSNVALGVLAGDFDAGAVKEETFYEFEGNGLKAIATTPPLSEHLFIARGTLPQETIDATRRALYRLRENAGGRALMRGIKPSMTGMVPVADSDYDDLREMLKTLLQLGVRP